MNPTSRWAVTLLMAAVWNFRSCLVTGCHLLCNCRSVVIADPRNWRREDPVQVVKEAANTRSSSTTGNPSVGRGLLPQCKANWKWSSGVKTKGDQWWQRGTMRDRTYQLPFCIALPLSGAIACQVRGRAAFRRVTQLEAPTSIEVQRKSIHQVLNKRGM